MARREAWHPQGPIHPQPRPVPLHIAWPRIHAHHAVAWGWAIIRNVVARGGVGLSGVGFWSVPIESVGASGVWGGWEGLDGRPPSLAATFTHPVINQTGLRGRPSRPTPPIPTTLAPTDQGPSQAAPPKKPTRERLCWRMKVGIESGSSTRMALPGRVRGQASKVGVTCLAPRRLGQDGIDAHQIDRYCYQDML